MTSKAFRPNASNPIDFQMLFNVQNKNKNKRSESMPVERESLILGSLLAG